MIISRSILLRMRNISDKNCKDKQKKHFMFHKDFLTKNMPFEKRWKNIVQPDRPQMILRTMCITCWIPKATDTLSEYVTLIALQQWLHESTSVLSYTCIFCIVFCIFELYVTVFLSYMWLYFWVTCDYFWVTCDSIFESHVTVFFSYLWLYF